MRSLSASAKLFDTPGIVKRRYLTLTLRNEMIIISDLQCTFFAETEDEESESAGEQEPEEEKYVLQRIFKFYCLTNLCQKVQLERQLSTLMLTRLVA